MSFTVSLLTRAEDIDTIRDEWEALDAATMPRAPFSSPTWNRMWWKHFHKDTRWVKDEFLLLTVRSAGNELVAVAPMFKRSFPSFGPVRARFIQFFGADSSITELRGLVCAARDQNDIATAVGAYFRDAYAAWDLLSWEGPAAAQGRYRAQMPRLMGRQEFPNYYITLPGTWSELQSRLTGKFKRNMRKRCELFNNDGFSYSFRCLRQRAEIAPALARFFHLHSMRAAIDDMEIKHPDRFTSPKNRNFLTEYIDDIATYEHCHIFDLVVAGETIGSQLAFAMDGHLWLYSSGFDPKWRKYGIMTMLTTEILKWAIDTKMRVVNLSCGQDLGKLRWNPTEVTYARFLMPAPTIRGRLLVLAYKMLETARNAAKWLSGYRSGKGRDGAESGDNAKLAPRTKAP
jgi:CelD/BcsL family acetyltransferase involved in cellulose biosynthesis